MPHNKIRLFVIFASFVVSEPKVFAFRYARTGTECEPACAALGAAGRGIPPLVAG